MTDDEREKARRRQHDNYMLNRETRIEQAKASQRRRWSEDPEGMRIKYRKWAKTQRAKKSREQRRIEGRQYYLAHREQVLAKQKRYYLRHRDRIRRAVYLYRKLNPEIRRRAERRYYLKNRERLLARGRLYYRKGVLKRKLNTVLQMIEVCGQTFTELGAAIGCTVWCISVSP